MIDLIDIEKYFVTPHIKPGGNAVDCTMGNGHDTLWLSRGVGASGHVWAFDIQQKALDSTAELLRTENAPENYTLILASHAEIKTHVTARPDAVLFNLGYLPGSGNKKLTTLRPSTRAAVEGALEILNDDGVILIAVYPGHEEGHLEGEMLDEMLRPLDRKHFCVSRMQIINSPTSPFFFAIEKR
ncbi:MAG: class I SAM-dependent methyltransferase [Eubacteriales bacterium]